MASPFIGLPISAELSNGTVVEGIIHAIDPATGKLSLAQARFLKFDGSFSEIHPSFILEKDSVKDLMLLSTIRHPSASSSSTSSSSSTTTTTTTTSPTYQPHSQDQPSLHPPVSTHKPTSQTYLTQDHSQSTAPQKSAAQPSSRRRRRDQNNKRSSADPSTNHRPSSKNHHRALNEQQQPINNDPDSSFSAHEDTEDAAPTPELSPPRTTTTTSQLLTSASPETVPSDFSQDFDFQAGLMAFDKAKLWAEIASTDSTDPKDRLIAHNRKKTNGAHFGQARREEDSPGHRNLGPTEMVLSAQEQLTNGSTVSNPYLKSSTSRANASILSTDGHAIYPVTLDRLNQALSSASVEHGPSLVQRIENAGRSMADYIITLLRHSLSTSQAYKHSSITILVGSHGPKASCAIRTGALLALKGFKVFLLLSTPDRKPTKGRNDAFEFQLRLFSSSGAVTCPSVQDLPSSPTLIIEALAENSVTSPPNHTLLDKALIDYTRCAPTLSIDILSYLNYDTGEPLVGAAYIPSHQYLVCLGAVSQGAVKALCTPAEVCLVDLTLSAACWKPAENKTHSDLDQNMRCNGSPLPHDVPPAAEVPAAWGDQWYTTLKIR
ncbi:hypothetical protein PCANC_23022 [Puccinia coronata f. sp. avenae]|uniref:Enhancer of mRNA-decapping protein 3 n=1 Tax=Puccinia coronata f. sp. avenae TaxID=200324 RepID=A0A2N5TT12_9BASI|nr:hypothetical protein PCANC_23022 [Puccinia coronata f. sp. avenae]